MPYFPPCNKLKPTQGRFNSGASRRIRTPNLLIRSQMLYPIEPWTQRCYILYLFIQNARNNYELFRLFVLAVIHLVIMHAADRFIVAVPDGNLGTGAHNAAIRIKAQMVRRQMHAARHLAH